MRKSASATTLLLLLSLAGMEANGEILIAGAMCDVSNGKVELLPQTGCFVGLLPGPLSRE